MKQFFALSLITICSSAYAFSTPKQGDKTKDILSYVSRHSEFPQQGFHSFDCMSCSALKNSVFITPISTCGTGSCNYLMFKMSGSEATYITTVSLKPGAFEFLKSIHNEMPDLKIYQHVSADDGLIMTMQFNGKTYNSVENAKKISAAEFNKNIRPEQVTPKTFK